MKQIREATRLSVDGEMLKKEAKKLADEFAKDGEGVTDIALSGSFGKYGEYALNDYFTTSDRVIRLKGDKQIGQLIIKEVFDVAKLRGANCVISPDALDEHYINAIYFYDTDSAIAMTDTDDNGAISLDKFLKNEGVSDIHSEKRANELYRITMEEAKRFFSIASDMHFRLEEHYSEAMDFAYNERVYKKYSDIILEKCKNS